jgi:hypothetical protein
VVGRSSTSSPTDPGSCAAENEDATVRSSNQFDSGFDTAAIDGAGAWQRFTRFTLPLLRPVTLVVLTLGLIYTVKVIMVVTQGGPANSSQTLTTYAYDLSFQQLTFGQGAAVGNLLILVDLSQNGKTPTHAVEAADVRCPPRDVLPPRGYG